MDMSVVWLGFIYEYLFFQLNKYLIHTIILNLILKILEVFRLAYEHPLCLELLEVLWIAKYGVVRYIKLRFSAQTQTYPMHNVY